MTVGLRGEVCGPVLGWHRICVVELNPTEILVLPELEEYSRTQV